MDFPSRKIQEKHVNSLKTYEDFTGVYIQGKYTIIDTLHVLEKYIKYFNWQWDESLK